MRHTCLEKGETVMAEKDGRYHPCLLLLFNGPLSLYAPLINGWASTQTSLICVTSDGYKKVGISPINHGIDRLFLSGTEQPLRCFQAVWNLSEGRPGKQPGTSIVTGSYVNVAFNFKKEEKVVFCFNHILFTPLMRDAYPLDSLGDGK